MARYANTFSPQTDIGSGMQNAVASLFSGKTPHDQALDAAHRDAYLASADSARAHAAKLRTEAEAEAAGLHARQNFLEDALGMLEPDIATGARGYLKTRETPQVAITSPTEMGPLGHEDAPWFTPGMRRELDTTAQLAQLLMAAKPSDAHQLAQARSILGGDAEQAGVLEGSVDPTRFAQSRAKPVSGVDEGYAVNMADPSVPPRELGIASALIEQRGAQANKDEVGAELDAEKINTEQARQQNLRASAKRTGTATKLVPTIDEFGDTIWTPVDSAAGERVGGKPGTAKTDAKKPLNKSQSETMAGAIAGHEADLGASLDAQTKARVTSRATQLATDPASEFYQDPAGAVEAAFDEVGELDVSGRWNPFKSNTATAKNKGAKPAAGAKAPAPAAPARGGKTDAQLIDEGNAAIKKGANKDAVMKRLRDMGVKVN